MIHVVVMKRLIGLPLLIHIELLWRSWSFKNRGVGVGAFVYRLHSPDKSWWQQTRWLHRVVGGVWGGVQGSGGYGGILDCYWCKRQAVLLHSPKTSFRVVCERTVCCIVLWLCDRIVDKSACDNEAVNTVSVVCTVGLERLLARCVVATRYSPRNLAHVHPPAFLAGLSCSASSM
jgi:hypothetical protein